MSRSAAALAYDLPASAPTRARQTQSAVKLLGGDSYRPATSQALSGAIARQRSQVSYLHLVADPVLDAYAQHEIDGASKRLHVSHPVWLAVTGVCVVALLMVVINGATHGRLARYGNRVPVPGYAASAAGAVAEIDTTSEAQKAEPSVPSEIPPAQGNYDITGTPTISVGKIEEVLRKYGSPAVGKGQALYDIGMKYGINPAFALAFFVHESGCGTKGVARFTHSLGNIRWTQGFDNYEGYRSYSSWEAGMEDWYKLITDLYINGWGLRTVDAIIPVYAPSGDNNNPPVYIQSVKSMVDSWRGK